MDPAGIGALIGISVMACGITCYLFYERRNRIRNVLSKRQIAVPSSTLQVPTHEKINIFPDPKHVKIKNILPPLKAKVYSLKNLNSIQASRQLLSTLPQEVKV